MSHYSHNPRNCGRRNPNIFKCRRCLNVTSQILHLQLSNVTIFLGLKGLNWLQSFEAQAIFLEIHFTREEYFDLSSFEKGTVVFFVSVSIFRDKVERSFFVIDWIWCFKLLSCFINMFHAAYINQFFSSRNENDQHGFQVWEWYSSL